MNSPKAEKRLPAHSSFQSSLFRQLIPPRVYLHDIILAVGAAVDDSWISFKQSSTLPESRNCNNTWYLNNMNTRRLNLSSRLEVPAPLWSLCSRKLTVPSFFFLCQSVVFCLFPLSDYCWTSGYMWWLLGNVFWCFLLVRRYLPQYVTALHFEVEYLYFTIHFSSKQANSILGC